MNSIGNSLEVRSNQDGPHPDLSKVVRRHRQHLWRQPIGKPTMELWQTLKPILQEHPGFILDSGCGTGMSTLKLAEMHPETFVLGVDKSELRLSKTKDSPKNAHLVRAELTDLWRLMVDEDIRPSHHTILYPNPWPKSSHLARRFHGHPIFPYLPRLCTSIELRSNWFTYLQEFQFAWDELGGPELALRQFDIRPDDALTLFERKYLLSGHTLFILQS